MAALSLLLLWTLCAIPAYAGNICYFPNGATSTDVPCDPDAEVTQCCGTRSACLSNGLCALDSTSSDTGISYARGTCTDKSWSSPLCPQQCQLNQDTPNNSSAYDFRAGGVQVWECGGTQGYGTQAEYCCESAAEGTRCCNTETAVWTLAAATVGPSTSVLASSTSSSIIFSSASRTISSLTPTTTDSTSTQPKITASNTSISSPPAQSSNNSAVRIGAGVGGALGGCLLIATIVLFIIWRKKRQRRIENERNAIYEKHDAGLPVEIDHDTQRYEVPTYQRYELPAKGMPAEMPVHGTVWELPAERK